MVLNNFALYTYMPVVCTIQWDFYPSDKCYPLNPIISISVLGSNDENFNHCRLLLLIYEVCGKWNVHGCSWKPRYLHICGPNFTWLFSTAHMFLFTIHSTNIVVRCFILPVCLESRKIKCIQQTQIQQMNEHSMKIDPME